MSMSRPTSGQHIAAHESIHLEVPLLLADEEVGGHVVLALDEDLAAPLELVPLAQRVHAPLTHLNEKEEAF